MIPRKMDPCPPPCRPVVALVIVGNKEQLGTTGGDLGVLPNSQSHVFCAKSLKLLTQEGDQIGFTHAVGMLCFPTLIIWHEDLLLMSQKQKERRKKKEKTKKKEVLLMECM